MARPPKNNCDYFPHLTTMRNHKKVKALRNKFGQVLGYAFWSMFVEYLTEQDGCEVENSEIELEMFAGELGVSVTEIQEMVNYCIRIEMLFLNKDNFIYSESLNENLLPVFEKRKKSKEISKARKRRENGTFIPQNNHTLGVTVTETPQSKVEEIKVNKDTIVSTWKNDFSIYLDECKREFRKHLDDPEFIIQQKYFHANVNIEKTIFKAFEYWKTEEAWILKKSKRSIKKINWKLTIANAINMNKVYLTKDELKLQLT